MQISGIGQRESALAATSSTSVSIQQDRMLRKNIDEFVGMAFYSPMLKMMRDSTIKGQFGHGGRGEEVFQAQLDMELASRAGRASQSSLTEALYKRLKPANDAQHRSVKQDGSGGPASSQVLLGPLQDRAGVRGGGLS